MTGGREGRGTAFEGIRSGEERSGEERSGEERSGDQRAVAGLVAIAAACALLPACGPSLYTFQIIPASAAVHSAEQAGAPEHSPYEYWSAHEYLDKAAEEANEGNYQDAIRFAERARELGELAQEQTSQRMRERREQP